MTTSTFCQVCNDTGGYCGSCDGSHWNRPVASGCQVCNLTQHEPTDAQHQAGVARHPDEFRDQVSELLDFRDLPSRQEVREKARDLAELAAHAGYLRAMIGGAPFLMAPLEAALREQGITPLYAFSRRESVEVADPDGSVRKISVFQHLGFVEA